VTTAHAPLSSDVPAADSPDTVQGAPLTSRPVGPIRAPHKRRRATEDYVIGAVVVGSILVGGLLFLFGSWNGSLQEGWPSVFSVDPATIPPDTTASLYPEDRLTGMAMAYGNAYGQQELLHRIEQEVGGPLGERAYTARTQFEAAFGPGVANIDRILSTMEKAHWSTTRAVFSMVGSTDPDLPVVVSAAELFVDEVEARVRGERDRHVLATLLSFHPDLRTHPEQEMQQGFVRRFVSDTVRGAPPTHFILFYPVSWWNQPTPYPDGIQSFRSEHGYGRTALRITAEAFPPGELGPYMEGMTETEASTRFVASIPGARVLETGRGLLKGKPAVWGTFTTVGSNGYGEFDAEYLQVLMQDGDTLVTFTFFCTGPLGSGSARSTFQRNGRLFQHILNTVEFF